ncbi:hypothetical protein [Xylocopilactobacillus apicola]|uniref:Transposase TnpC homeodomain domain-containing protein n=1 Tax=Xylocopilactobacillus apicola TaxID=2932184 RepID=A0AAU9DMJ3_9LACO|nr:hypothetical protein [Xylocopilactobacillus apicola]BDR58182.1 hypothetical protein XA3_06230 [Xylocopilactobacillus apicola]
MTTNEESLIAENKSLKAEIVWLKEQLADLNRTHYGSRSDKTKFDAQSNDAQSSLFGEKDFFEMSQTPLAQPRVKHAPVQYKRVKGKLVKIKSTKNSRSEK